MQVPIAVVNLNNFQVVKPGKMTTFYKDILEGHCFFPYEQDERLPNEDIAIVIATNGTGMFQPTLMVDHGWVNLERRFKFFEAIDVACHIYQQMSWEDSDAPIRAQ